MSGTYFLSQEFEDTRNADHASGRALDAYPTRSAAFQLSFCRHRDDINIFLSTENINMT